MSWKDRLLPGSFRGVPFFLEDHSFTGGRRLISHEFPNRDDPFTEDLGRKARSFSITGHLIGEDVFQQRRALEAAFEKKGDGVLIHPYFGRITVKVDGFSTSDSTQEGRITKFNVTFLEAGTFKFPELSEDRESSLFGFVTDIVGTINDTFGSTFDIINQPAHVVQGASDTVNDLADTILDSAKLITTTTEGATNLAFNLRNLKADVNNLLNLPSELGRRLIESLSLLTGIGTTKNESLKALFSLTEYGDDFADIPNGQTVSRQKEVINRDLIKELTQRIVIARAAETSLGALFASTDEAVDERLKLSDLINRELNEIGDDELFSEFRDLNAVLVDALPDQDSDIPVIMTITPATTVASLVLAYDLYDALENEQDIIDRNNIANPGFIPGQQPIEVLSA